MSERTLAPGELRRDEPMSRHVSWRAGGCAARCYRPRDRADLVRFVQDQAAPVALHVVGLGSNLLVRDGGLDATVVLTHGALRQSALLDCSGAGALLEVEAGVAAPKVARMAAHAGLAGAEFLAGIPGTLGGALAMNAGCHGDEIWNHVQSVTTLDRHGVIRVRTPQEYHIGYRHVQLITPRALCCVVPEYRAPGSMDECAGTAPAAGAPQTQHAVTSVATGAEATQGQKRGQEQERDRGQEREDSGWARPRALEPTPEWFLAARLQFSRGSSEAALQRIRELLAQRVATQPLNQPNAGSVFRNPPGDHAARLIEACGLKGAQEGAAEVSFKHANFIINRGQATARQIERLIQRVQQQVLDTHGVALVTEVRIVGEAA